MPRIQRPKSWVGMPVIDVVEAAHRLGRSKWAVFKMVERGQLHNIAPDRRVLLSADEVESFRVKFLGIAQMPLKLNDEKRPVLRLVERETNDAS